MNKEIIKSDKAFTQLFNKKTHCFSNYEFCFLLFNKKKPYVIVNKFYVKYVQIIVMSLSQNINVRLKKLQ